MTTTPALGFGLEAPVRATKAFRILAAHGLPCITPQTVVLRDLEDGQAFLRSMSGSTRWKHIVRIAELVETDVVLTGSPNDHFEISVGLTVRMEDLDGAALVEAKAFYSMMAMQARDSAAMYRRLSNWTNDGFDEDDFAKRMLAADPKQSTFEARWANDKIRAASYAELAAA